MSVDITGQARQPGDAAFEPFLIPMDGVAESIRAVLEPTLATLGLELVQLFFVRGSHKDTVRLFVDHPMSTQTRVSMADLERANRLVSDALDVADGQQRLFPHAYDLEVGSPGVDRPLTKRSHLVHARNERVKVKTRVPVAQARSLTGTLLEADAEHIALRLDGQPADADVVRVRIEDIQSAHTIYVFETPQKPGRRAASAQPRREQDITPRKDKRPAGVARPQTKRSPPSSS